MSKSNQQNGFPERNVEIVHQPSHPEPAADVDLLAVIERRNEMMGRILDYAIKATHAGQWVDQSGKPYPTAPAAEVMARRCAVSIKNVQTNKVPSSDDKGPFYLYVVTATASLPGGYDSIEAMGTCSSRDTFLGTETKAGRNLSDIDEGNILKAAYSNMLVNAITRLLGVRNITWDRLAELGIDQGKVAKVEYHSGSRGGGNSAAPTVKFGKNKGTPITELSLDDLAWQIKAATDSVAKNDDKWHKKNVEWLETLRSELKGRATSKDDGGPATTVWDQIKAMLSEAGVTKPGEFVKSVTGKDHSSKLTEEDIPKVREALDVQAEEPF